MKSWKKKKKKKDMISIFGIVTTSYIAKSLIFTSSWGSEANFPIFILCCNVSDEKKLSFLTERYTNVYASLLH